AGDVHRGARHSRHSLRIHARAAPARRGGRDVRVARADPACDHSDATVASVGGPAMSTTTADRRATRRVASASAHRRIASPLVYRLQRFGVEAMCLALGFILVVWSLTPIYNMWKIALDSHAGIFGGSIWPEAPTLESFRVVVTQDFWYLERFWHKFGNSFIVGLSVTGLTLAIG